MKFFEIKTSQKRKNIVKLTLWLRLAVISATGAVSFVMLINSRHNGFLLYFSAILMTASLAVLFPYLIFFTRAQELLSTQKIYAYDGKLLFYFAKQDGNTAKIAQEHYYFKVVELKKLRTGRLTLRAIGRFQTKTEGYAVLDVQNPDEPPTKLDFTEQVDLIFYEDSYLKRKSLTLLRIFDEQEEKKLAAMLVKANENVQKNSLR